MTTPIDMALAAEIVAAGTASGKMVVTAESCTGGMVAAALTDISGASAVLDRGLVTYSNDAKSGLLGVAGATLASHGAVSAETAAEMAAGALVAARKAMWRWPSPVLPDLAAAARKNLWDLSGSGWRWVAERLKPAATCLTVIAPRSGRRPRTRRCDFFSRD